jgi:hypothetical protein
LLPEPALLIAPSSANLRYQRIAHYLMLRDALLYFITSRQPGTRLLSPQEWREVLKGRITETPSHNPKLAARASRIEAMLAPALAASGHRYIMGMPLDPDSLDPMSVNRAREIVWEVAEINFRFELTALDRRASGLDRPDECRACFDGYLLPCPLEDSQRGFAAAAFEDRRPTLVQLARLMSNWAGPVPRLINDAAGVKEWTADTIRDLEEEIAVFYCQSFYDWFGRAAVIPLRLEHPLH